MPNFEDDTVYKFGYEFPGWQDSTIINIISSRKLIVADYEENHFVVTVLND